MDNVTVVIVWTCQDLCCSEQNFGFSKYPLHSTQYHLAQHAAHLLSLCLELLVYCDRQMGKNTLRAKVVSLQRIRNSRYLLNVFESF